MNTRLFRALLLVFGKFVRTRRLTGVCGVCRGDTDETAERCVITSNHGQIGFKFMCQGLFLKYLVCVFLHCAALVNTNSRFCYRRETLVNMPQLNGGGGDELGANDEMISFKDEGEQEDKISENVSAERDLDDVKSSLVNESENNSSSSDSEVSQTQPHVDRRMDVVVADGKITFLFCFSALAFLQQAERRPQPRPDHESYEKAREYFAEGEKALLLWHSALTINL